MPRSCEAAHEDSKVEAQRGEIHHIATDHGPMVQGVLLTAHTGGVHGYGWYPGGGFSFRQGARRCLKEKGKSFSLTMSPSTSLYFCMSQSSIKLFKCKPASSTAPENLSFITRLSRAGLIS